MDNLFSDSLQTYDIAKKGKYFCMQCGGQDASAIISVKDGEMLPECKKCGFTTWVKILN